MNVTRQLWPRAGLIILLVQTIPVVRQMMEGDMALHMLVQFPLILIAGWLLAQGLSGKTRAKLKQWNLAGISGMLLASMVLMFWMIPRALDMVLTDVVMESWKFISLALAGAALELSWGPAGMIVRGFFLGNVLPMMMVVGWLYIEAPVRICNAYLTDDQLRAGSGLLVFAMAGSVVWLLAFFFPQNNSLEKHAGNQ